jgi:hypothetical protein
VIIGLDLLVRYWQGELPADEEARVEVVLFDDETTARRLDAIARLEDGLRRAVAEGKLQSTLTVDAVAALARAGLTIRSYAIGSGEVVPCTIAHEDLVVIRLRGDFAGAERVDVVMDGNLAGAPGVTERYDDVAVDRKAGEVVLVYPGDRIRSLPRSQFRYAVSSQGRSLGEFGLDHHPAELKSDRGDAP